MKRSLQQQGKFTFLENNFLIVSNAPYISLRLMLFKNKVLPIVFYGEYVEMDSSSLIFYGQKQGKFELT